MAVTRGVILLLLIGLARCRSFIFAPTPLVPDITCQSGREPLRQARHRGIPSRLRSSSGNSQEDINKLRQSLMASSKYNEMVDRIESNSRFVEVEGGEGNKAVEEAPIWPILRKAVRVAVDIVIVLVPVVLVVSFANIPPPLLEALGSVATVIKASPLEPILEALPWEPIVVLKWAAQGGVALVLSPIADRLVVSPAVRKWVQIRIRSISS